MGCSINNVGGQCRATAGAAGRSGGGGEKGGDRRNEGGEGTSRAELETRSIGGDDALLSTKVVLRVN